MGSFLKCFYECKKGPDVQGVATYQEITTIMLTNQSPDPRVADVFYFDGKEQCIAHSSIDLSPVDLDELSVCHTLESGGLVPPAGGVDRDPRLGSSHWSRRRGLRLGQERAGQVPDGQSGALRGACDGDREIRVPSGALRGAR